MAQTADDRIAARFEKLLRQLTEARNDFVSSYAGLTDAQLLEPGVTGDWSIRDLIAHVTWWDEESLEHLPVVRDGGRPPRYADLYGGIDAFNAQSAERRSGQSLAEVRDAFDNGFERLVAYLRSLQPDEVVNDARFRRRLRLDTYGHYPEHAEQIRAWRAEKGI